jgi:hypothetical protein
LKGDAEQAAHFRDLRDQGARSSPPRSP